MARVKNDHVVTVFQVGQDRDVAFVAMERLEGEPLDAWLKRGKKPSLPQALKIARETAKGLAAAHAKGLVHRDVKPGNLWLEAPQGRVKILDFGLARLTEGDTHVTQSGAIVGTPAYMAPEQARGHASPSSDLFSLGIVMYRLLTGQMPFQGNDTTSLLTAIALDTPNPIADLDEKLPTAVADLVMSLLAKDPAQRPKSAQDVVTAIQAIERTLAAPSLTRPLPVALPVPNPGVEPKKGRPWNPAAVAAAVVIGMLGIGGALLGVTLYRFATDTGELVVQVDDPNVEVTVKHNGVVVMDKTEQREFVLTAGDGEVIVTDKGGLHLATRKFTLQRGGKQAVVVTLRDLAKKPPSPPAASASANPFDTLRRDAIPADVLKRAGGGDPANAPKELVAVFGDSQQNAYMRGLEVSRDGRLVFAGNTLDHLIHVWDVATGQKRPDWELPTGHGEIALSHDGRCLAHVSLRSNAVLISDAVTGQKRITVGELARTEPIYRTIALNPDGTRLATANEKDRVKVWDTADGKTLFDMKIPAGFASELAFSPDGQWLVAHGMAEAAQSTQGFVTIWNASDGKEVLSKPAGPAYVSKNLAISPDSTWLVVPAHPDEQIKGKRLEVWAVPTGMKKFSLPALGRPGAISPMANTWPSMAITRWW